MNISPSDRAQVAKAMGLNDRFVYQCLTGRRAMGALDSVRIERESQGRIRRWHVRPADWHLIWPELIGTDGAPPIPGAPQPPAAAGQGVEVRSAA